MKTLSIAKWMLTAAVLCLATACQQKANKQPSTTPAEEPSSCGCTRGNTSNLNIPEVSSSVSKEDEQGHVGEASLEVIELVQEFESQEELAASAVVDDTKLVQETGKDTLDKNDEDLEVRDEKNNSSSENPSDSANASQANKKKLAEDFDAENEAKIGESAPNS